MCADIHSGQEQTNALFTGRIKMCKTNPSLAHIGLQHTAIHTAGDQSTFSAVRLRDQVRASRTTLESWRATKPTTMGNVQCNELDAHSNFAGEPLSHIGTWQDLSARWAINMIDKHRHAQHV
jgi:hypothetical protein